MKLIDIDELLSNKSLITYTHEYGDAVQVDILKTYPAAEEKKKGKWIEVYNGNMFECSECNTALLFRTNYCPVCGADMKEVQNE